MKPSAGTDEVLSASYARWRSSPLGRITDQIEDRLILKLLDPVDRLDILDVGCGDGRLAAALSRLGARVTGLDPDGRMLAAARARARAESVELSLVSGHAEDLPFADAAFDCVSAVAVLCFLSRPDRAVAEMARVLRPGGRLLVGDLGRWSLWAAIRRLRGWMGHPIWRSASFRTANDLCNLIERQNLMVESVRGAVFYPPVGRAAELMEPVDSWLGERTSFGAAFLAALASKPGKHDTTEKLRRPSG